MKKQKLVYKGGKNKLRTWAEVNLDNLGHNVKKIRELEKIILPDDLPNIARLRELFLESSKITEEGSKDYQKKLKKIEEKVEEVSIKSKKEANEWKILIPQIDRGIQEWTELETKAWEIIKKSI